MRAKPILYETHVHTPLCGHAVGEPTLYAEQAGRSGLAGIVFTCHNPTPNGYGSDWRMAEHQFTLYTNMVAAARREHEGSVDVRLGLECDYLPEFESWLQCQIASAPLEYVLGSIHAQYPEYLARFGSPEDPQFFRTYFDHLALAAESRLFDCLAHPDIVKIVAPERWSFETYLPWIADCLDRVAATGVAIEFNTSGTLKAPFETYPGPGFLQEAVARGIPVVIGSDAHMPTRVGTGFENALVTLAGLGAKDVSYFAHRSRVDVSISEALASLRGLG